MEKKSIEETRFVLQGFWLHIKRKSKDYEAYVEDTTKTHLVIVKDQFSHLVYPNIMHKLTHL